MRAAKFRKANLRENSPVTSSTTCASSGDDSADSTDGKNAKGQPVPLEYSKFKKRPPVSKKSDTLLE